MPEAAKQPETPSGSAAIRLAPGSIRIRDEATFGPAGKGACAEFLARAFAIDEVRSVRVDQATRTATIGHEAGSSGLPALLGRLASAIRGEAGSPGPVALPGLRAAPAYSIHRHGADLTTWEVIFDEPGRLKVRHEALRGDAVVADRLLRATVGLPGVLAVKASETTGHLLIRYSPATIGSRNLLGVLDGGLREPGPRPAESPASTPAKFALANLTLGVAAVGEFAIPILRPISAVLLVATNLRTLREARLQLERKRLGLPVLYLAIVATTLLTGQFVASALMTWFFRFWHRRFRVELATERGRLLAGPRNEPTLARLLTPSGTEVLVAVARLRVGDRLVIGPGEALAADGRALVGEGIVDERAVRGLAGIARKQAGDTLLAGSTVLAGAFHVEVVRLGDATRAAMIRRALVAATNPAPGPSAPTIRSERFASRAVGPTLATAGVGLLAGDLLTVGAILRPDYATGPGLAIPLETLHDVALCARLGVVARDPEALERLAEVDLFVLQDHPVLSATVPEVTRIETRLPETLLLRYAASAFRHLVDPRASALLETCRARRIHVLDLDAVDFGRGVTVVHDRHRIRVIEAEAAVGPLGRLAVEVDGAVVGLIEFGPTDRPEAASAIDRIRRESHVPFALVSPGSPAQVSAKARALGVEMYRGDFSASETADFLAACKAKGLKAAFVGDCRSRPRAAAEAYVAISLVDDTDLDSDPAGLLIQQHRLAPLADLHQLSLNYARRVVQAQRFILVPNLVCVAGAFLFGFTGLTAVMLSNLGTLGLYRIASDSLRSLDAPGPDRPGRPRRAG